MLRPVSVERSQVRDFSGFLQQVRTAGTRVPLTSRWMLYISAPFEIKQTKWHRCFIARVRSEAGSDWENRSVSRSDIRTAVRL
ncbi:hypothetical protein E8L90_06060 [Brevibacillus antibioticus]|uniref:Uncharacterized protein n=1 Tax=Brevibacillus antibioticus TaxID=2570228 RepID=A0A4U2Y3L1_9BACL|nr:hypothetical protein [Brevibacillus antibioticus]TKI55056.1 hypothetical protein E8L90_06060 [Brevibacillus antibioticus]